ncbi:MAG: hypothetical protein WEB06_08605 [Actinomycetota bacterium]
MKRRSASFVALLFLAACTVTSSPPDASPTIPGQVPSIGQGLPTPGSTKGAPAPGSTSGGSAPAPSTSYQELAAVGAMAKTYLQPSPASSLVVEVDWMSGRKPSSSALTHLASILNRELAKPGGVDVRLGAEMATTDTSWTVDDLVAAERAFRAERSGGARVTMWIAYLGGSLAEADSALGAAFAASAAVLFRDRIGQATSALIMASEIERSVLTHEVGHLLGLVNIGYQSRFNHEDPTHPKHSSNRDSVMYWAVEDISLRDLLSGGPPADFDEADRADLAMLRG